MSEPLHVLITAGASGIGLAMARGFTARGDKVHICDISPGALGAAVEELPGIATTLADVSRRPQVERLFDELERNWGKLDVLVNNAGIAGPTAPVEAIDPQDWEETMAVNINGQFYCARRAVPLLKASQGAMINLSSAAGRFGFPLRTPYAASKWAVRGFTESLAMELGPAGVRVNAILPGVVAGERINRVIGAKAEARGISFEEQQAEMLSRVSLRRMVSAEDIANMALFLCSPVGANISGQALSVCGNVEVLQ